MPTIPLNVLIYAGSAILALLMFSMMAERIPFAGTLLRIGTLCVGLTLAIGLIQQKDLFRPYFAGLTRSLYTAPDDDLLVIGKELRIPMSRDGHFWAHARINGVRRRLLIDSGVTTTALSTDTAATADLVLRRYSLPAILKTPNGTVIARRTRVETLRIVNIVAYDLPVVASSSFDDTEVIGMNFLSKLKSWRVEGTTMVLEPHHPQITYRSGKI